MYLGSLAAGSPNGTLTNTVSSSSTSISFLDIAGNSRYQSYNLARFSTFSAASVSSTSSTFKSQSSEDTQGSSTQADSSSTPGIAEKSAASAHSNSVTASNTPSRTPSSSTDDQDSKDDKDDKDDAWAVNESYSGHGGLAFRETTPSNISVKSDATSDSRSDQSSSQPSLSSYKDSSSVEAAWRRTSDSSPTSSSAPGSHGNTLLSSQNNAGGLDLSSSTLVQQMLFKERPPHSQEDKKSDANWKQEAQAANVTKGNISATTVEASQATPSLTSLMEKPLATEGKKSKSDSKKSPQGANDVEEDHISKLDIRVGIVRSVANHPDAESLYIEQVDVGDMDGDVKMEPRTIVSGLVRHVPKEYLEGRAVIVVGNMKPSKLRGVLSQGMLLCAMEQDSNGQATKVALLEPAEGSQAGDKVIFEGFTDEENVPVPILTPKRKWFEKAREYFAVRDGVAYYKGSPFRTVKGLVRCRTISTGQIS
ncbi:hypothetical protein BGZ94_004770 [Podila epigama]|nr:hypothetical protein BGZ94_004770 [Podila epigama]